MSKAHAHQTQRPQHVCVRMCAQTSIQSASNDVCSSEERDESGLEQSRDRERDDGRGGSLHVVLVSSLRVVEVRPLLERELLRKLARTHVRVASGGCVALQLGEVLLEERLVEVLATTRADGEAGQQHLQTDDQQLHQHLHREGAGQDAHKARTHAIHGIH